MRMKLVLPLLELEWRSDRVRISAWALRLHPALFVAYCCDFRPHQEIGNGEIGVDQGKGCLRNRSWISLNRHFPYGPSLEPIQSRNSCHHNKRVPPLLARGESFRKGRKGGRPEWLRRTAVPRAMHRLRCSCCFSLTTRFTREPIRSSQLGRHGTGHLASLIPHRPPKQFYSPSNFEILAMTTRQFDC